jgi:uncharacterized protein YdaU (DUF1376 family)
MSNHTPLTWFKEFPAQQTSSPKVIMLNAAARGIYVFMRYHCWLNIALGGGIPNDDTYILRIANCTAEEWQENKAKILKNFEERDGELFVADFHAQADHAYDNSHKRSEAGKASGRARSAKTKSAHTDMETDDDEMRQRRQTEKTDSMFNTCSQSDEQAMNTCSPPSPSSFAEDCGVSSPPDSSTSGRIAAPTLDVPLPDSSNPPQEKSTDAGNEMSDVQRLRAVCFSEGGKMPMAADVKRLLAEYSVGELEDALRELADNEDSSFLEYKFFVDGGAEALITARRNRVRA